MISTRERQDEYMQDKIKREFQMIVSETYALFSEIKKFEFRRLVVVEKLSYQEAFDRMGVICLWPYDGIKI